MSIALVCVGWILPLMTASAIASLVCRGFGSCLCPNSLSMILMFTVPYLPWCTIPPILLWWPMTWHFLLCVQCWVLPHCLVVWLCCWRERSCIAQSSLVGRYGLPHIWLVCMSVYYISYRTYCSTWTLNVTLLNYPVLSNSCYIFKGQTNLCLSFQPTEAEQPRWGNECPLFGHSYPLKDAFEPDQARIGKHSISSR